MRNQLPGLLIIGFLWSAVSCDTRHSAAHEPPWVVQKGVTVSTTTHFGIVFYGYTQNGGDGYVAFSMVKKDGNQGQALVSMGAYETKIIKPDGTTLALPCKVHLFECIDGAYKENGVFVEKEMLDRFLSSKPREYSIAALMTFVEKEKGP